VVEYRFVTVWRIEAPIEAVWEAIYHSERWPTWWKSVTRVVELAPGDERGLGGVRRYFWKSRLPYTLRFEVEVTRVERPVVLEGTSRGELVGRGTWTLSTAGPVTTVRNTWEVRTTTAWMNLLAPLARPLFAWNHAYSMRQGGLGLATLLGARLVESTHG
jgi:uncharacterized protein YndB with AHSA1/START domain